MRVRAIRQRLGLSQFEVARRARVHPATLSKIESGHYVPYPAELRRIARALRVELEDLQEGGEDSMTMRRPAPTVGEQRETGR